MSRLFMVLVLGVLACKRGPGQECSTSDDCADDGACLKGVCSAYACNSDLDCGELSCGRVAGSDVCVQACQGDADCSGEQTCTEVATEPGDTGPGALVCL